MLNKIKKGLCITVLGSSVLFLSGCYSLMKNSDKSKVDLSERGLKLQCKYTGETEDDARYSFEFNFNTMGSYISGTPKLNIIVNKPSTFSGSYDSFLEYTDEKYCNSDMQDIYDAEDCVVEEYDSSTAKVTMLIPYDYFKGIDDYDYEGLRTAINNNTFLEGYECY